jgi:hypothetical protein
VLVEETQYTEEIKTLLSEKMHINYERCKKGIHKLTNSKFIKGKEIKSCHCGEYTNEFRK